MLLLLLWSGEMLTHFPTGWELHVETWRLLGVAGLAILFGLLLPLQVAALGKARAASGMASAGTLAGLLSVSCCAPFIVPAVLSFAGFSGTALLSFNGAVRQLAGPLTLASLVFMAVSVILVTRTLAAACRLPAK
jgi:hypothetical protein